MMKAAVTKQKITKLPPAPSHFSLKARHLWTHIHQEFTLEPDAVELLRVALENLDLGDQARASLRRDGSVLANGRRNPALDGAKLFDGMYLRAMRQLGLDIVAPSQAGRRA